MNFNDRIPPRPDPKLDRVVGPAAVIVTALGLPLLCVLIAACTRMIGG